MEKNILVIGALIILSAFCFRKKEPTSLYDTNWMLAQVYMTDSLREVPAGKAFIRFDRMGGRVGGNGSCNRFGGNYIISGDSISLQQLFSTKMYCEATQSIENNFLGSLQKVDKYEIKGNQLFLIGAGKSLLVFTKEKS